MVNETTQGKEAPEIKFRREANIDPQEFPGVRYWVLLPGLLFGQQ